VRSRAGGSGESRGGEDGSTLATTGNRSRGRKSIISSRGKVGGWDWEGTENEFRRAERRRGEDAAREKRADIIRKVHTRARCVWCRTRASSRRHARPRETIAVPPLLRFTPEKQGEENVVKKIAFPAGGTVGGASARDGERSRTWTLDALRAATEPTKEEVMEAMVIFGGEWGEKVLVGAGINIDTKRRLLGRRERPDKWTCV